MSFRPIASQRLPDLPLWRPRVTPESLAQLAMTEASFAAGYLMRVIRPGDLMLPHFPDCWQSGVVVSDVLSRRLPAYLGVDLAGKTRAGNFIVAVCVDPRTQLRYVVAARHGAWSSPDLVTHLADICSMLSNVQVIMV